MKYYLVTFGCQMNKYTSGKVESLLNKLGYTITTQEKEADLILVNTCSVRDSAEERAIGRIRTLAGLKRQNPNLKIGVIGCMAVRLRNSLFELIPRIDFSLGPNETENLPALIEKGSDPLPAIFSGLKEFVAISTGCDNFCSYCIVPFVRGNLVVRQKEAILSEIKELAESGTKEITLLGQDVTSFRLNGTGFPELLSDVARISGIERIRFLTSHPKGVDDQLIDVVAENPKLCPHFHLPLQSGSDRVLRDMNRGYTFDYYFGLINKIRKAIPSSAITTDIIVGFPKEARSDFEATLKAIEMVRPDSSFCFAYSARPGTPAERLPEIDQKEKSERLKRMIELTKKIAGEKNSLLIDTRQDVLIEAKNPKDPKALMGRTITNKVCLFEGGEGLIGKTVPVHITSSSAYTLKGRLG
ncbi:MAG: tRNA (N6-isopentenyl adenosine(37)-C2)-methylthiotransferase MiaB [bacterium]|nr:tRNA (N6-isopentenyl adenosine(37)-C2)-methylthiotransferase MiaB [bacterium]